MTLEASTIDWQGIAEKMDERVRKYEWPAALLARCPRCGGAKCKLRTGHTYRCIYCCYEVALSLRRETLTQKGETE